MKEKKFNYIYKTTCTVTCRYYIGMHSTNNINDNYLGSGTRLRHSIRKYGKERHIKEILEYCKCRITLAKREAEIVSEQLISEDLCMNLKPGGFGGVCSENHIQKMKIGASNYLKQKWQDIDYANKMNDVKSSRMIKRHKEGKYTHNKATFKGKTHSDETKSKMSETKKGTGLKENNSQFGTCWITNGVDNKKIKLTDIQNYIGWLRGRSKG